MSGRRYIQRRDLATGEIETVDEFGTAKEAWEMVKEYAFSDRHGEYYVSRKATGGWDDDEEEEEEEEEE